MLSIHSPVQAVEGNNTYIIDDTYRFFTEDEKIKIQDEVKKLPETYKIVILPTVHGSIENSGKTIFKYQQLSQDTILIMVWTDDKKIYGTTGDFLKKKGLDDTFFQKEIDTYFVTNAKTKPVSEALISLIQGISKDIPKHIYKDKVTPKLPDPPKEDSMVIVDNEQTESNSKIIYGVLGLSAILVLGLIVTKGKFIKK